MDNTKKGIDNRKHIIHKYNGGRRNFGDAKFPPVFPQYNKESK